MARRSGVVAGVLIVASATFPAWTFVSPGPVAPGQPHAASAGVEFQPLDIAMPESPIIATEETAAEGWLGQAARWLGAGVAAGLLAAVLSAPAQAYTSGYDSWNPARNFDLGVFTIDKQIAKKNIELCKSNKKFNKRFKDELYRIQQRQKKYPAGSVVYNRFVDKLAQIKRRQEAYGDRLCGTKDGLPRLLVQPDAKRGGVLLPALMFLYTAGWIGWAGRSYLIRTRSWEKEINIDVPLALTCMASGFAWPVNAWQDIVNGEMVEKDENLYKGFF